MSERLAAKRGEEFAHAPMVANLLSVGSYEMRSPLRFGWAGWVVTLNEHPGCNAGDGRRANSNRVGRIHDSAPRRRSRAGLPLFILLLIVTARARGFIPGRVLTLRQR